MDEIDARIQKQLVEDVDFVLNSPFPDTSVAAEEHVYAPEGNRGGSQ
jgi:hypothetical protein